MSLTPRQQQVAEMVARGMSNKAIAQQTGISRETVNVHIRQAADRVQDEGKPRHKLTMFVLRNRR